eukprot:Colp12_sorted_trinity150504_noHs@29416
MRLGKKRFYAKIVVLFLSCFVLYSLLLDGERDRGRVRDTGIARDSLESVKDVPDTNFRTTRIAYFVQISLGNVDVVQRLLPAIYNGDNVYALYFDKRIDLSIVKELKRKLIKKLSRPKNVYFLQSSMITYRGISMVLNTLESIVFLLRLPVKWNYFINLSGADYPLQTQADIQEALASLPFSNLSFISNMKNPEKLEWRWRKVVIDPGVVGIDGNLTKPLAEYPEVDLPIELGYGSAWMILSRAFCEYSVNSNLGRRLLAFFSHTTSSPEHYFQTLAYNSEFSMYVINDDMRSIVWTFEGKTTPGNQHPFLLDDLQYWSLVSGKGAIFARKFTSDSPLLDQIDQELLSKSNLDNRDQMFDRIRRGIGNRRVGRHIPADSNIIRSGTTDAD